MGISDIRHSDRRQLAAQSSYNHGLAVIQRIWPKDGCETENQSNWTQQTPIVLHTLWVAYSVNREWKWWYYIPKQNHGIHTQTLFQYHPLKHETHSVAVFVAVVWQQPLQMVIAPITDQQDIGSKEKMMLLRPISWHLRCTSHSCVLSSTRLGSCGPVPTKYKTEVS